LEVSGYLTTKVKLDDAKFFSREEFTVLIDSVADTPSKPLIPLLSLRIAALDPFQHNYSSLLSIAQGEKRHCKSYTSWHLPLASSTSHLCTTISSHYIHSKDRPTKKTTAYLLSPHIISTHHLHTSSPQQAIRFQKVPAGI
jgi:hypothetical protein